METKELLENFAQSGLRATPQRIAIYQLLSNSEEHPTAHQIFSQLKNQYPSLSLATVYNTLESLTGLGFINALGSVGDGKVHFDANITPHINLACLNCHKIIDASSEYINEMDAEIQQNSGYKLRGSRILYFGFCPSCQNLINKSESN